MADTMKMIEDMIEEAQHTNDPARKQALVTAINQAQFQLGKAIDDAVLGAHGILSW